MLQRVAACCSVHERDRDAVCDTVCCSMLQCVAVCCSVLQRTAASCSVLQCVAVCKREIAMQCVIQIFAVCCSVLQCVASQECAQRVDIEYNFSHTYELTRVYVRVTRSGVRKAVMMQHAIQCEIQ